MSGRLLECEGITRAFSGVTVLDGVSLSLDRGMVLGVVGENGAGKSTLMNILGGVLPRDGGTIQLDGAEFSPADPREALRAGIVFIHQELNLFTNLSVAENIFVDGYPRGSAGGISYRKMHQEARRVLSVLGETINPRALAGDLPMGTRQIVEISKALKREARIMIFDEPTTSLSTKEKERLFTIIGDLARKGVAVIYISHMLDDVLRLCGEIAVLRDGKLMTQAPTAQLSKALLIRLMVGRELSLLYPYVEKKPGGEALRVENLTQGALLKDVSVSLREGEIVGMFGLMGAGRSEFVKAVFGVDAFATGSIYSRGSPVASVSPSRWIRAGVALITENRREEGLLMPKPVRDNLVLANLPRMRGPVGSVSARREGSASDWAIERLHIRTHDRNRQKAMTLSGGNQQKTVIGKWLLTNPRVFLLDEPTRGIDVGAKFELYTHINELALGGSAVLFISSEMEELMGICDRIIVLCRGRVAGEVRRGEFNQETILKLAIEGDGR